MILKRAFCKNRGDFDMEKTGNILSSLKLLLFNFHKPRVMMKMKSRLTDRHIDRQTEKQ